MYLTMIYINTTVWVIRGQGYLETTYIIICTCTYVMYSRTYIYTVYITLQVNRNISLHQLMINTSMQCFFAIGVRESAKHPPDPPDPKKFTARKLTILSACNKQLRKAYFNHLKVNNWSSWPRYIQHPFTRITHRIRRKCKNLFLYSTRNHTLPITGSHKTYNSATGIYRKCEHLDRQSPNSHLAISILDPPSHIHVHPASLRCTPVRALPL